MKSLIISLVALGGFLHVDAAQKYYSWWFDDLTETTAHHGKVGSSLDLEVEASSLSPGIHTMHILVREEDGAVSNVVSQPFIKTDDRSGVIIHYCLDGEEVVTTNPKVEDWNHGLIWNLAGQEPRIHTAYIIVSDHDGAFLSVVSQPFVKTEIKRDNIVHLCVDGELLESVAYDRREDTCNITGDLSELAPGIHNAHILVSDHNGAFLNAVSQPFAVPSDAYRKTLYLCVDGELREQRDFPVGDAEHRTDLDLTDLALGTHTAQAFVQDSEGMMSEIKEGNFERVPTKAELGEQVGILLLEEDTGQCRVYDLQGRPLKNASEEKIVIRNGRKEAGKH